MEESTLNYFIATSRRRALAITRIIKRTINNMFMVGDGWSKKDKNVE